MSALTPVTTRSITPVSGSTNATTDVSNFPATIHGKSVLVKLPPSHTRVKTAHAARNEPATLETATQWARRPMRSPRRMLTRAPASGRAGMNQTVDTASC